MGPGSRGACHRARIRATRWLGRDDGEFSDFNFQTAQTVIASEAKQSILPRKERMDCFVASAFAR
jgi:hypothetical protein